MNELEVLYRLKPHFRDVVVEGREDAAWLSWFLTEQGAQHVKVFAVDDRVNVPSDLVEVVHADVNARGRVIALATAAAGWGLPEPSITCVIDSDFDLFDGVEPSIETLLRTDYAAMEVYALKERPMSKFLVTVAKSELTPQTIVSLLWPAWAVVYTLRYVLHRHSEGTTIAQRFADKCIDDSGAVIVDARELLRTCAPTPDRNLLEELLSVHAEYLEKVPRGTLQGIRGHDVAPLLIRFLGLKNELAHASTVERLLRQSVESADLVDVGLFRALVARLS